MKTAKKVKRTARSTSIRLTPQAETKKALLADINALSASVNQLRLALFEARREKANLIKILRKRDIEIARMVGYVDRVREVDEDVKASPAERETLNEDRQLTAEQLIDMGDEEFDAVIEGLNKDQLKAAMNA